MPVRLRPADPALVGPALARFRAGAADGDDLRLLTKHLLALLVEKAPGGAVEVRVPPYAAAQCLQGTRHTRGTPPAAVEMDAATWIALAIGDLDVGRGRARRAGGRLGRTVRPGAPAAARHALTAAARPRAVRSRSPRRVTP